MDVMRPELKWVDGCCFRINVVDPSICQEEKVPTYSRNLQEYDDEPECLANPAIDNVQIVCDDTGKFTASLHVASAYFPLIIGSRGTTRKRLETETRTHIFIPKMGQEGDIKIKGLDHKGVSAACRRIGLIVMSSRQRQAFTHFLSLSMAGEEIQKYFLQFKKDVLEACRDSRGICESVFQREQKLHLTLGTLALLDKVEREQAAKTLEDAFTDVIIPLLEGRSLKVQMKGLEYMNDDPAEVDVLYGQVQVVDGNGGSEDILQKLADDVAAYFTQKGFMQKEYDRVKLHVTLMNTIFRKEEEGVSEGLRPGEENDGPPRRGKPPPLRKARETFDARSILEKFQDYYFGEQVIDTLHLSQRYSTGKNGYYQSTAKIILT
ncbi:activating signal cointegrator 1 complex subunit 1 [Ischnura elegans]|uniref:activating signal cointegrator 1 complex subunit 1 n=1 Tax=Ischnura elegans TaxID=197161 RepID=UPI001ED88EAC|nr:activating signal cointegrator 1 complex subunit 1 [Ischnura elegans]